MDTIQVTVRMTIHEGKLKEFKELAAQCMRSVRERDTGKLLYDWFFNDTHTECVVREAYKNSGAVLEHIANLGVTMGAVLGVCDGAFEVFGSASVELVKAASGLDPEVYWPFQSI